MKFLDDINIGNPSDVCLQLDIDVHVVNYSDACCKSCCPRRRELPFLPCELPLLEALYSVASAVEFIRLLDIIDEPLRGECDVKLTGLVIDNAGVVLGSVSSWTPRRW